MQNLPLYVFATIIAILASCTLLVTVGKLDPTYATTVITGLMGLIAGVVGYLNPSPIKKDLS